MKTLFYIISTLFLINCTKSDESNIPKELIGKWKLIEIYSSDGSNNSWYAYDSGREYDIWFKENSEVIITNMIESCQNGSFSISDNNEIVINLPCSSQSTIPIVSLTTTNLITDVTYIEYELNKYVKIND